MERLLNLEATSYCNANCSMCPRNCVKEYGYISLDTVDKLIDKIGDYLLYEISISGRGEPTFHPQLIEIIKKLQTLKTKISVVTTTDGIKDATYKQLIDELDIMRISVSSIDEQIFKKIHRGLNYDKIWKNITKLVNYNPEKLHIHLVGGEETYPALEKTISFFKANDVNNIYLLPLWNRGGNVEEQEILNLRKQIVEKYNIFYSEDEYLDETKVRNLANPNYCPLGDTSISVNHRGDMIGCFQDFENLTKICSVDDDVDFITERVKVLKKMPVCRSCNSYNQARK